MGLFGAIGAISDGMNDAQKELRAKTLIKASAFVKAQKIQPFDLDHEPSAPAEPAADSSGLSSFIGGRPGSKPDIDPQVMRIWRSILLWFAEKGLAENGFQPAAMSDDQKTVYLGLIRLMAGQIHIMSGEDKALIDAIVVPVANKALYGGAHENPASLVRLASEQDASLTSNVKTFIKTSQMSGALDKTVSKNDLSHMGKFHEMLKFFMENGKPVAKPPELW